MTAARASVRMADQEAWAFLGADRPALALATHNRDGTIHMVAMWFAVINDQIAFWTFRQSQKAQNLFRDPRLSCLVETGEVYQELKGVEVVGRARLVEDPGELRALGQAISARYSGPLTEQGRERLEKQIPNRIGVFVETDRIVSWDHTKLAGGR